MRTFAVAAGASVLQIALAKPFLGRHANMERRSPQVYGFPSAYEPAFSYLSSLEVSVSTAPRVPDFTTSTMTISSPSLSTTVSPVTPTSESDSVTSTLISVSSTLPVVCACPPQTVTVTQILPCPTSPPYASNSSSSMMFPTSVISSSIDSRVPFPLPTTNISAVFPTSSGAPSYSYSYPTANSSTVFPTSPITSSIASRTPFPFPTTNTTVAFPTNPVSTSSVPSYPYPTLNTTAFPTNPITSSIGSRVPFPLSSTNTSMAFPTRPVTSSIESRTAYPVSATNTSCTYPTSPITSRIESRTPFPLPTTNSSSAFPTSPMTTATVPSYSYPSLSVNMTAPPSTISSSVQSRLPFPVSNSSYVPSGTAVSSTSSSDQNTTIRTTVQVTRRVTATLPLPTTSVSPVYNSSSSSVISSTTDLRTGDFSQSSSSTFVVSISTITDRLPTSSGVATMTSVTSSSMQTPGPSSYPTGLPTYGSPPPTEEPKEGNSWLDYIKHLIQWFKKQLKKLRAEAEAEAEH